MIDQTWLHMLVLMSTCFFLKIPISCTLCCSAYSTFRCSKSSPFTWFSPPKAASDDHQKSIWVGAAQVVDSMGKTVCLSQLNNELNLLWWTLHDCQVYPLIFSWLSHTTVKMGRWPPCKLEKKSVVARWLHWNFSHLVTDCEYLKQPTGHPEVHHTTPFTSGRPVILAKRSV